MRVSDIISLLKEYLFLGIVAIIFLSILFFIGYKVIYRRMMKGKRIISKKKILLYGITICYAVVVLGAVFLNRSALYGEANLHLFSSYKEAYHKMEISLFRNNVLNILLFVPLGFLLPIYSEKLKKIYKVVPIGFILTLIIETLQYRIKIGIFEIDDIFNNTVGVLFGYCIYMIFNSFRKKQNRKYIIGYVLPIIVVALTFIGIYFKYENQELGNLSFEYNYKVNMKNVNVENKINISKDSSNQTIYYTKILTEEETRKLAENLFEKLGTEISEDDIDIYENTAIYYSTDRIYNIWITYKGGTYSYTDFSKFSFDNEENNNKTGATREEVEVALQKLGVEIPQNAEFQEKENGYIFNVDMEIQENYLINGNITCSYYEDETIKNMKNNIVKYEQVKDKEIISQEEAYNEILQGKFQYDEYYLGKIQDIVIEKIELKYDLDSKGYYVPVYVFDVKINNQETVIQIKAIR